MPVLSLSWSILTPLLRAGLSQLPGQSAPFPSHASLWSPSCRSELFKPPMAAPPSRCRLRGRARAPQGAAKAQGTAWCAGGLCLGSRPPLRPAPGAARLQTLRTVRRLPNTASLLPPRLCVCPSCRPEAPQVPHRPRFLLPAFFSTGPGPPLCPFRRRVPFPNPGDTQEACVGRVDVRSDFPGWKMNSP